LRQPVAPSSNPPAQGTAAAGPLEDAEFKRVAAQYIDARDQLVALLEQRRNQIAPETLAVVEENLKGISSAVGQIQLALSKEPQSHQLERMLYTAYRSEVDLLRQAVQLTDDPAASNPADDSKGNGNEA